MRPCVHRLGLLIQTVSGMMVLNGALVSMVKVEGEEKHAISEEEVIEQVLEKGRRALGGVEQCPVGCIVPRHGL
eukprot:SAG11_NODE_2008_length_3927_cov_7.898903_3_plen_74_part_00